MRGSHGSAETQQSALALGLQKPILPEADTGMNGRNEWELRPNESKLQQSTSLTFLRSLRKSLKPFQTRVVLVVCV